MSDNKLNINTVIPARNFVQLLFIISFTSVFFFESSMALACLCGGCLPTALRDVNQNIESGSSERTPPKSIRTCNFVKGNTLRGVYFSKHAFDSNDLFTPNPEALNDCHSAKSSATRSIYFHGCGIARSIPVYLKTLSIRC